MASTSAAKHSSATKKLPNWLEMPDELMADIFQRLRTTQILKCARKVCTTWRRICNDPAMWKVIVIHKSYVHGDGWNTDHVLEKLTKQAVDLSCGELVDISISGFGSDDLLDHIVLRSSKLKSLRLMRCLRVTRGALIRAVKTVPQLETLHLPHTIIKAKDIELIGQNCPQLKSLTMTKRFKPLAANCDDNAFAIADNMPELRHLKLSDNDASVYGLNAILNGCPHLQSLDVRGCPNIYVLGDVGKLCYQRMKVFKFDAFEKLWDL